MVRQNPGGGGSRVLNRKIFEIEGGATAQFLILAVDIQAGSFQNCWFTVLYAIFFYKRHSMIACL